MSLNKSQFADAIRAIANKLANGKAMKQHLNKPAPKGKK